MTLDPGTRLGPYEVVSAIGAGGMGEVYKARDTRLDRVVAIKVLPEHLTGHPELRQRFEQEARAVSSLNHAHICTLYDVGQEGGVDFLVMELIEGETLLDCLARGAISWREAVAIAIPLADALDKAHRAGVVHRDLKPGNIILTKSGPKLLDFGLAKLRSEDSTAQDVSAVTEARPLTEKGAILGTFQYMSPEQLEAKEADARSDIFALGAVLHEMVTGEKTFQGTSQASLIAAILKEEPRAITGGAERAPASLDRVVRTCLEKDPDDRWQSAADLKRNLEWIVPDPVESADSSPAANGSKRLRIAALLAFGAGVLAALLASVTFERDPRRPAEYFDISIGPNEGTEPGVSAYVALSPDGDVLAYTSVRGGTSRLYLRRFDEAEAREVPGSEGAYVPFFSPDGEWVAFQTYPGNRQLKRVSVRGGAPQVLHESGLPGGGAWLDDDRILFSDYQTLHVVSPSGGEATPVGAEVLDSGGLMVPQPLPGEGQVLVSTRTGAAVLSLETGEQVPILDNAVHARYVAPGYLMFVRGGALWFAPFDPILGEVVGSERPIVPGVEQRWEASFAVSEDGRLAFVPGSEAPWIEESLAWADRSGEGGAATQTRLDYEWPRVSPSGEKIAVHLAQPFQTATDIAILDVASGRLDPWTFDGASSNPVWAPGGESLVFARGRNPSAIYIQPLDQSTEAQLLLESDERIWPFDIAPDGSVLAFSRADDIILLSLVDHSELPFASSEADEDFASFSPDGRFIAYTSDESGRAEVYVQPYPPTGAKKQVSRSGGGDPTWSADATEIFYLRDRTMTAARVKLAPEFEVLGETELFDAPINRGRNVDFHPQSGRFIVVDKTIRDPARFVRIVTNVFDLIEADTER